MCPHCLPCFISGYETTPHSSSAGGRLCRFIRPAGAVGRAGVAYLSIRAKDGHGDRNLAVDPCQSPVDGGCTEAVPDDLERVGRGGGQSVAQGRVRRYSAKRHSNGEMAPESHSLSDKRYWERVYDRVLHDNCNYKTLRFHDGRFRLFSPVPDRPESI